MSFVVKFNSIIAAAAINLLIGCAYDEMVGSLTTDEELRQDTVAISFGNCIIDAPTRSLTLLSEHTSSMGVWGWQKSADDMSLCLFRNQPVTFDASQHTWTYSPGRYWESGSSYRFYAYAPHSTEVDGGTTVNINESTGWITIEGITLQGDNTMSVGAMKQPYGNFSSVTDTDWMIDRAGRVVPKERIRQQVTFNMQHILSKLNVMVRCTAGMEERGISMILDSMSVGQFPSMGTFRQQLDHSPAFNSPADQAVNEWQVYDSYPLNTIMSACNVQLDAQGKCVVESLVLPHSVGTDVKVKLFCSIPTGGGTSERVSYQFDLHEAIAQFLCATNHTLYITIGVDVITFDSGAAQWEENNKALYD